MVPTKRMPFNYKCSVENLSNMELCFGESRFQFHRCYCLRLSFLFNKLKSNNMESHVTREKFRLNRFSSLKGDLHGIFSSGPWNFTLNTGALLWTHSIDRGFTAEIISEQGCTCPQTYFHR